ncbi:P-loop containing nucleoside triphosphate hydrolase protein [Fusarium avenaceum]|nr:P-loop containing nucleoside triphosphate hydrolase protein [Fusarium avenaceum]
MPSVPRYSRRQPQSPPPRHRQYSPASEIDERRRRGSVDDYERGYRRRRYEDDAASQFSDQDGPDHPPPPKPEREVDHDRDVDADIRYRPMVPFSWRNEICRLLEVSPDALDDEVFQAIDKASKILKETEKMRALFEARQGPPRYQVIHSVRCEKSRTEGKLYLDQPWVVETGPQNAHLRGSQPILNFELFLERNKEVVAIIYKNYRCCGNSRAYPKKARHDDDDQIEASSLLISEEIAIISEDLKSAMVEFSDSVLRGFPHPKFEEDEEMKYPYIWWFHRRKEINGALERYQSSDWFPMVNLVREYMLERMTEEWEAVDDLLSRRKICLQYMGYLFVPEQLAISTKQGRAISKLEGVVTDGWLEQQPFIEYSAIVDVTFWTFDGMFHKTSKQFAITDLPRDVKSEAEEFAITDLPLYPIEYASSEVAEALRQRGRMFWKCRFRNYVSLSGDMNEDIQDSIGSRFMVDIATHKKLHREGNGRSQRAPSPGPNDLEAKYMSEDNPDLADDFFMCLPTSIFGFNMDKKEWVNLDVHYLRDVVWNTEAFDLLVVQEETKTLIQAVVTNQLRTTENADLIQGKGNGLFILLHGGPGTGKTLTAESVAEVAKKPLYRVTCGDIGTKAEDVEQYLNVVLHLGKTWGCVVLLDEADVFLEQRSLVNLERNALVSVFLRVLEYYDGILILTSNRVGIFDEAFKSRIQLNLRYKNLDRGQRLQIWKNFFIRLSRLEQEALKKDQNSLSYGVNVNEMTAKLDELADANLNGRQIRNAISTARQLSRYLKEPLGYKHLTAVIDEAKKFDEYLLELNRTYTADEIQRDKGER